MATDYFFGGAGGLGVPVRMTVTNATTPDTAQLVTDSKGVTFTFSASLNNVAPATSPSVTAYMNQTIGWLALVGNSGGGPDNYSFSVTMKPSIGGLPQTMASPVFSVNNIVPFGATAWKIDFIGDTKGPATLLNGPNAATGSISGVKFSLSNVTGQNYFFISKLNTEVSCFVRGTEFAGASGTVRVEDLRPGDVLRRADGGLTRVRWVGRQEIDVRLSHPAKVNPICISAGTLGDGVPARDLWLSGDHAVCVDGMLINAAALANGETIYQVPEMPLDGFTYFHVETDAHELLLAEGCPCESFIDYTGRDGFENAGERAGAPGIGEMELPRISAERLVPEAVRTRLADRGGDVLRAA